MTAPSKRPRMLRAYIAYREAEIKITSPTPELIAEIAQLLGARADLVVKRLRKRPNTEVGG